MLTCNCIAISRLSRLGCGFWAGMRLMVVNIFIAKPQLYGSVELYKTQLQSALGHLFLSCNAWRSLFNFWKVKSFVLDLHVCAWPIHVCNLRDYVCSCWVVASGAVPSPYSPYSGKLHFCRCSSCGGKLNTLCYSISATWHCLGFLASLLCEIMYSFPGTWGYKVLCP